MTGIFFRYFFAILFFFGVLLYWQYIADMDEQLMPYAYSVEPIKSYNVDENFDDNQQKPAVISDDKISNIQDSNENIVNKNDITISDDNLDSVQYKSLFFNEDELDLIHQSIKNLKYYNQNNQSDDSSVKSLLNTLLNKKHKAILNDPEAIMELKDSLEKLKITLESIIYINKNNWSFWINDIRFDNDNRDVSIINKKLTLYKLSQDFVIVAWEPADFESFLILWSKELIYDKRHRIYENTEGDVIFHLEHKKIYIELSSNNTFDSMSMIVFSH